MKRIFSTALCTLAVLGLAATSFAGDLPVWPESQAAEAARFLHNTFYEISGWKPVLLEENRLKAMQQEQISAAIDALLAQATVPAAVMPPALRDAVEAYPPRGGKRPPRLLRRSLLQQVVALLQEVFRLSRLYWVRCCSARR